MGGAETGLPCVAFGAGPVPRVSVAWRQRLADSFLDHLAETCDVVVSAQRVGISPTRAYRRLRSDAAFAAAWGEAIQAAYLAIETKMIAQILSPVDPAAAGKQAAFDWDRGLRLLQQQGKLRPGRDRREGASVASREETDKAIERRLVRLAARRAAAMAIEGPGEGADV